MKSLSVILIFLTILVSCGESPLLNHKNEKSKSIGDILPVESGLSFKKAKMGYEMIWEESPRQGDNKFELRTWSLKNGTDQGPFESPQGQVFIYLWMPSMGHGSVPVEIKKIDKGEYLISNVMFIMGGTWEIRIQLKKNGKVYDEAIATYHL